MKALNTLLLIFISIVYTSCDKSDSKFIPTKTLYDKNINSSNITLIWNGETIDLEKEENNIATSFYFENSDTTKLFMSITKFRPIEIILPINIISNDNKILFTGSSNEKPYDLEVTGTYSPSDNLEEPGNLELNCTYKINDRWFTLDYQYIFRFDDNRCMYFTSFPGGSLEWDGQTIAKIDFLKETLNEICDRIGKETAAIGFTFHADETVDVQIQKTGEDFKHLTSFQYSTDYYNYYNNKNAILNNECAIFLKFNEEQANYYENECIGLKYHTEPLLDDYYGKKYLILNFIEDDGNMIIHYPYPQEQVTLRNYLNNRGSEGLSDKEKEKQDLLFNTLINTLIEDGKWVHHIYLKSEPYQ